MDTTIVKNTEIIKNDDALVEKISCYQAFKESESGTNDRELTDKEQKCLQWLIVMLDIIPPTNNNSPLINDEFQIKYGDNNSVLKTLFEESDWKKGPNTELKLLYSDESEADYKFQQAEYCWKDDKAFKRIRDSYPSIQKKTELNGVSFIEDYDLSPYHDQPGKFEREEGEGEEAKKIEQALFFISLILPNDGEEGSADILGASELVQRGFFIHKDQVCPVEHGRPLVFLNTKKALELEDKKAICKVRVRALKDDHTESEPSLDKEIKSYEKKRVIWASVMIQASDSKEPTQESLDAIQTILADVNDWSQLEETVLEQPHEQEQFFNIKLHKTSDWAGADKTYAKVEIDLTQLWRQLEHFYYDDRVKGHFYDDRVKHHFYIFPLAIAPRVDEEKYNKLGTPFTGWKETESAVKGANRPQKERVKIESPVLQILASYAVTTDDMRGELKDYFSAIIPYVLDAEGGFVDHPNDHGKATNMGITFETFKTYAVDVGKEGTLENLKKLTADEARHIYLIGYWDPIRAGKIYDPDVAHTFFDMCVNAGQGYAVKGDYIPSDHDSWFL